jgi:hypothetical protein
LANVLPEGGAKRVSRAVANTLTGALAFWGSRRGADEQKLLFRASENARAERSDGRLTYGFVD